MNTFIDLRKFSSDQAKLWVRERMPSDDIGQALRLADIYYRHARSTEPVDGGADEMYGAFLCLWQFIQQRPAGQSLVRAYNPTPEEHQWHSTHSVIEILSGDMPFLVSSMIMELDRQELHIHGLTHPVINVVRDKQGKLQSVHDHDETIKGSHPEALIRIEIERQPDEASLQQVVTMIRQVLADVHRVIDDWPRMQATLDEAIDYCASHTQPVAADELEETLAFLRWLKEDNFLFIGYRYYELAQDGCQAKLCIRDDSGLGTFRKEVSDSPKEIPLPESLVEKLQEPELLVITKSTTRSTIQRPAHLDYLGIKHFDEKGNVVGEWRFFGLFSSKAYSAPLEQVPLLRVKVQKLLDSADVPVNSHAGRALRHIVNQYPRDELLQAGFDNLHEIIMGVLECQERRELRVFIRPDSYGRFINAMVYVPRDRFNTEFRLKLQQILLQELDGHSIDFSVQLSENPLAQVQFTVHCQDANDKAVDVLQLETLMTDAMMVWQDHLQKALVDSAGEAQGSHLARRYVNAFPAAYREDNHPRQAVADIERLEGLENGHSLHTLLYHPVNDFDRLHFRVLGQGDMLALSDVLPILEHMGVRTLSARPYSVSPRDGERAWVLDFAIAACNGLDMDDNGVRNQFQETFVNTWKGTVENDGFNALVISAGLGCRQIVLLRALAKYLLQLQVPFSQKSMEQALNGNPAITRILVKLFETRFDPAFSKKREKAIEQLLTQLDTELDAVSNLDEDRILRHYLSVIQAMLRTNYYQRTTEGGYKPCLSFKVSPEQIPAAPLPRPKFEIFVYSPRVEGVHMRGGKVARGGLRWSDRREDFRTEVLGLVKAQLVKNAVIVPVGAKGGFIPKQLPSDGGREALMAEGIASYRVFISGLLDITDNLVQGDVVPPQDVVRHDEDDPYLVVAADKGTATFSDIANDMSARYDFWLGDAFASGGSQGYDHKKMGITARGAWESVKRLFRERGVDTQQEDFTVVGVGDMAGDVFGNGMLLSEHIRLVAAFNHMHIFIDPQPDAETSFVERQRLFNLPRSSWEDYDKSLISKGGGIFSRQAKSISLTPEMRKALGIEGKVRSMTPSDLIRAILMAPVDLLWNGGIGTYVKASTETHLQVGDRANDSVRIDAPELRAAVVGEGGNLGITQRARIEIARNGGLITTDAVDNSGGVDSSDHEVNIKILLNQVVADGDMTVKQRNTLLASMTDEVAGLVLRHNFLQSQRLSLSTHQSAALFNDHRYLLRTLEEEGRLNRQLECLPSDQEIKERAKAGEGLSRPEISVLLSYSKLKLFDNLVEAQVDQDASLAKELPRYFPTALRKPFVDCLDQHPLKTEILATHIANMLGNRMGATFVDYLQNETRCQPIDAVRAYAAVRDIFDVRSIWDQFEQLGLHVDDVVQREELTRVQRHVEKACIWMLRNHGTGLDIEALVNTYRPGVETVAADLAGFLGESDRALLAERQQALVEAGMPEDLALTCASFRYLYYVLDIVSIATRNDQSVKATATVYFGLEDRLTLNWLRNQVRGLPEGDLWQRKAKASLRDQLDRSLGENTGSIVSGEGGDPLVKLNAWLDLSAIPVNRWQRTMSDIENAGKPDLAMLSVAMQDLALLANG
ncbi:NAD-glutamate dehydrogenase [Kistimonas scapharcae]|uniref:NAD-glutamate dehydrogenase n=1 Tax=Kistimonas scapharcae TaxID=1036133 RepID=A0ABP8V635_9GAMM